MNELGDQSLLSQDEIWKAHILKAKASTLSDVNYCKKNGLSIWIFSSHKKKLGFTQLRAPKVPPPQPSVFVKAVLERDDEPKNKPNPKPVPLARAGFPDPAWLAEFTRALLGIKK